MVLRYWQGEKRAWITHDVDRVLYQADGTVEFRTCINNVFKWKTIQHGKDYRQFSVTEE